MHDMARGFLPLSGTLSVMDSRYGELDGTPWYLDTSVPNVARVYDYLLGGKDNYAVDRAAAAELVRLIPDAR